MLQRSLAVTVFLAVGVSMGATDSTPARTNSSVAEILARNIEARGGLQAWRAVQSMTMEGEMGAGGNQRAAASVEPPAGKKLSALPTDKRPKEEIQLPFTIDFQRSRKQRLELLVGGKKALQVYDGENGWKLRPYLNRLEVEPFSDSELKASSTQPDLDGYLVDYSAKGTQVQLEGMEKVEDRDTYRLKLTLKGGREMRLWIDAQTYLETKIDGLPRRLDGIEHPVEVYYHNYQEVNGLRIPMTLETRVLAVTASGNASKNLAVQIEKIVIEKVQVNPKLDASLFTKPVIGTATASKPH